MDAPPPQSASRDIRYGGPYPDCDRRATGPRRLKVLYGSTGVSSPTGRPTAGGPQGLNFPSTGLMKPQSKWWVLLGSVRGESGVTTWNGPFALPLPTSKVLPRPSSVSAKGEVVRYR